MAVADALAAYCDVPDTVEELLVDVGLLGVEPAGARVQLRDAVLQEHQPHVPRLREFQKFWTRFVRSWSPVYQRCMDLQGKEKNIL